MKKILISLVCLAGAVLFVVLGISGIKKQSAYTEITATISNITSSTDADGETTHSVEVTYTVDGKEYTSALNEYNAGMSVGNEIQVKYNPSNPGEVVKAGSFGIIMNFVIAVICLISSGLVLLKVR